MQIFIWIGKGSNEFERKESMKTANVSLLKDPLISCVASRIFEESCLFGCFKEQLGKVTENKIIKNNKQFFIILWPRKCTCSDFNPTFPYLSFQNYLISDPTGRNPENTVMTVAKQGFEPLPFTGQFPTWDYDLWNVS